MDPIVQNIRDLIVDKQEVLLEKLNFGACDASISSFKSKIKRELPQIFYDFYSIFNGCVSSGASIWTSMSLLPMSGILNEKSLMDKLENDGKFENWIPGTWWNPAWVPFLSDFSNSLMCIDTNGSFNGKAGQILHWQNDNPSRYILFESFGSWLEALYTLIKKFDADIIKDKNAYADFCLNNINIISKLMNPEYPKHVQAIRRK
jgi:cell wall assembly regulator SMI1